MKLLLVCMAVLATVAGDQCSCQKSQIKYYTELGCSPVQPAGACCPVSFDCESTLANPATLANRATNKDKCHLKGQQYAPGARIASQVVGDPCVPQCVCLTFGPLASLRCVTSECPELFGDRTPPNCVRTYTPGQCCSTGTHCEDTANATAPTAKDTVTCEYEGKTYVKGQQFYPATAPCKKCICQQGYDGTLNGPWCSEISCGIEIHYGDNIHNGCAPIFFGTKRCCPIGWRCPAATDQVVAATGKKSSVATQCKFGSLTLNVGDSVSSEKTCQKCSCTIPPHVSCVQTGNC